MDWGGERIEIKQCSMHRLEHLERHWWMAMLAGVASWRSLPQCCLRLVERFRYNRHCLRMVQHGMMRLECPMNGLDMVEKRMMVGMRFVKLGNCRWMEQPE